MKKNFNFKLISWFLVATFILVTMPRSALSMNGVKSKARWMRSKAAQAKEKTIDRLVEHYRATVELRRKKAAGTATPAELAELHRRMKKIKISAAAIGITLITIAAIAAGAYTYSKYLENLDKNQIQDKKDNWRSAILQQDAKQVEALIKGGVNIEKKVTSDLTPLQYAIEKGNVEIVTILIKGGAKIDDPDYYGNTNLIRAINSPFYIKNLPNIIQLLIDKNADVNAKNHGGVSPMSATIKHRENDILQLLIDKRADIEDPNKHGYTLLHYAAQIIQDDNDRDALKTFEILIKNGANTNAKNNDGKTPLELVNMLGKKRADQIIKRYRPLGEMQAALPRLAKKFPAEVALEIGRFVGISKEDEPEFLKKYWKEKEEIEQSFKELPFYGEDLPIE